MLSDQGLDGHKKQDKDTPDVAHEAIKKDKYTQPITRRVTPTTPNPSSRSQSMRFPDRGLRAKSIDVNLDKITSREPYHGSNWDRWE